MHWFAGIWHRIAASILAGLLGAAVPLAAYAQTCPPGYYFASDGNCYPGPPPTYPAPSYDVAPPVAPPPVVMDGVLLGLGILLGSIAASGRYQHPEEHRAPAWHGPERPGYPGGYPGYRGPERH
jgi:hypothetical protein